MNASHSLFQPSGIPRQIVVDHQVAELKVDAFASRLSRDTNLRRRTELFLSPFPLVRVHPAMDLAGRISPFLEVLQYLNESVVVLGENDELAATVPQFLEFCFRKTLLEGVQL